MNKQEFSRRVMALEGRLHRISFGMLQNRQDQLDAVQEAICKAWANLHRLRMEDYFETWLTRILINECHNIQSARKRTLPLEIAPEIAAPDGVNRELRDAVMKLDGDLRIVIILHFMEGYKTREIAKILRIPEGTVKTRLLRAKKKLKLWMEEE